MDWEILAEIITKMDFGNISEIITAVTSFLSVIVVLYGLFRWKKVKREEDKYFLAKDLLTLCYELRYEIRSLRRMNLKDGPIGIDHSEYFTRFDKIRLNLQKKISECESIFGDSFHYIIQPLQELAKHLIGCIGESQRTDDYECTKDKKLDLFHMLNGQENDKFDTKVNKELIRIRKYLNKYLK